MRKGELGVVVNVNPNAHGQTRASVTFRSFEVGNSAKKHRVVHEGGAEAPHAHNVDLQTT